MSNKETMSNNQIIDELLDMYGLKNDNQLAKHFGVERQQILQFKKGSRVGLTQAIVTELIEKAKANAVPKSNK
ncbi:hypothetical protein L1D14_07230 [Vibrio tubiashii]|uniref:hypothetical protein n=1 Tax=Vibrio tubiashii TaxID=29498 RepID=UPI001EFC8B77|nr:hypothetical protein [Vibrio tubiashii]MCG9576029.1 hypothetical protein [Vibrio tubiashii]